ncbi:MAG: hypothetical protein ACYTF2_00085 [Planctomycetota bacterium]|jgi:hypothetical protein
MRHRAAVLSVILCGAWSAQATAQFELGGGDVLDANTGSAYGGLNLPAPTQDFRNRNLLITGNVVGGRGFRGTVGYTAAYDFRASLGSNDLFAERANSAWSDPQLLSAGRTLERMRFGQYRGSVEYRRAGYGSTTRGLREQQFVPQPMIDDRINLDHFAISSTTSSIYEAKGDGRVVGLLQDAEGQKFVARASSLLGVQVIPTQRHGQLIGLTSYDMARVAQDAEAGRSSQAVGQPFQVGFGDLRATDRRLAEPLGGRVEPEVASQSGRLLSEPAYREILERIEGRYAATRPEQPEPSTPLDEQFELLRELLAKADEPDTGDADDRETGDGRLRPRLTADFETLTGPLRHGAQLDHLTAEAQNRFQELLAAGEKNLRSGEYFWAERRFERALRFTPGHPLASAGKGHAQIGAGLYAPAALTLRRLLTQYPEMIDVRYGPELLPNRVRLHIAVDRLRQLVAEERDRALHALLLAYIGHQLDRPDLVKEGLELMGETSPDDPLGALLEKVWLPVAADG